MLKPPRLAWCRNKISSPTPIKQPPVNAQYSGAAALPLYFAATLGLLAAYTFYRLRHVSDLVAGEQAHFVPMLRTSHTVLELMPDAPPPADDIDSDNDHPGDEREPVTTSS